MIITTAGFTRDALDEAVAANKAHIALIDGVRLVELLIQHDMGVKVKPEPVYELDLISLGLAVTDATDPEEAADDEEEIALSPGPGRAAKYSSALGLPGENLVETLHGIIGFIGQSQPTSDEISEWMLQRFPTLRDAANAARRAHRLSKLGLVRKQGSRLVLSDTGNAYNASPDPMVIQRTLFERFLGFTELIEVLRQMPGELPAVHGALAERLGMRWRTPRQTEIRLKWLQSLGLAERTRRVWQLR
jgi:hypothetical protein